MNALKRRVKRFLGIEARRDALDAVMFSIGEMRAAQLVGLPPTDLRAAEFKVFSQFGEDGIIQYLVNVVDPPKMFVEIGVEDYRESNTRFLLMHNNWSGIIADSASRHIDFVQSSELGWRHHITPLRMFATAENVNEIVPSTAGLLSIDVDGMDYWLWEAVRARPEIVVIEYNSLFGPEATVTTPYDAKFVASNAHWSAQYFGASLAALVHLAKTKGYELVGGTSAGVNAFFVRADRLKGLVPLTAAEAWVDARYRSARNPDGTLSYLSGRMQRLSLIKHLPLVDVRTGDSIYVDQLLRSASHG